MAKCPYCDFNSHVRHKPVDQATFVTGYEREIAHMAAMAPGREVTSIFFGGGTPSLMEPATLERILAAIDKHWHITSDAEISLEANPTSVEAGRFKAYRAAGVNRVSLGIQSLRDDQLKFLGRMHSAAEARAAIELARGIFPRLSFDLIYARPEQTLVQWEKELREAIDLAADHLSLYQLTIEQGTPFYELHKKGRFQIPDQDLAADLYELTADITKAHNLAAYEISNYAAEGMECQHNLVYWRYQDYAGIGPGAHGRITTNEGKIATACERNPENWWQKSNVNGHGMITQDLLTLDEQADELLVMNLRLREGFDPAKYEALRKKPFDPKKIAMLKEFGFIESTPNGWIRATPSGFLLLDAVVADLAS